MTSIHCCIIQSKQQLDDALKLRFQVFGEELGLLPDSTPIPREFDALDTLDTTLHFLAYADDLPVGTVRLLLPNPEIAQRMGTRFGFYLEHHFDLSSLDQSCLSPAELTRFCILKPFRHSPVLQSLYQYMRLESLRRGISHWIASANTETDSMEDALIIGAVAKELGLGSDVPGIVRKQSGSFPTEPSRPFYSPQERRKAQEGRLLELALPRPVQTFARLGARFMNEPMFDARFRSCSLPLVACVNQTQTGAIPIAA